MTIPRALFEDLCEPLFERINTFVNSFFTTTIRVDEAEINDVVLVGGCSYMPRIQ